MDAACLGGLVVTESPIGQAHWVLNKKTPPGEGGALVQLFLRRSFPLISRCPCLLLEKSVDLLPRADSQSRGLLLVWPGAAATQPVADALENIIMRLRHRVSRGAHRALVPKLTGSTFGHRMGQLHLAVAVAASHLG